MLYRIITPLLITLSIYVATPIIAQHQHNYTNIPNNCIRSELNSLNAFIDTTTVERSSLIYANALLRLATLQEKVGQTKRSHLNIHKAIKIFRNNNSKKEIVECLDIIGELYRTKKNLEKALINHLEALEIAQEINYYKGIFHAKNNLAIDYRMVGNIEKAERYLYEILSNEENHKIDSSDFIFTYNSLGILYTLKKEFDQSFYYFRKGLNIEPKTYKQKERYGGILNNYGNNFRFLKNNDSALYYFKKSYAFNKLNKFHNSIGVNLANFAIIKRSIGDLDSALFYHKKSLRIVNRTRLNQIVQDNYYHLASIYAELNDYKNAHYYQTKYSRFKDSTFAIKDAQKLAQIEISLATEEKSKQEAKLQNELNQKELLAQKYSYRVKLYVFIIFFMAIVLVLGFFMIRARNKSRKILNKLNEDLEERVIERTLNLSYEIDRHKKTEQELKKSEDRWNKAQEVGKIGNWEYDLLSHNLWGSKQAFKILKLNYRKSPIYTNHILHKVHKEDLKKVVRAIRRIKKSDKKVHLEFRLKSKGLKQKYVLIRAELIYSIDLNPIKISGTIQDITYRKIVENELLKAKEKAEESDRLKSAFLSNMSHEIRTPMNAIIGFSDLLSDSSYDSNVRNEYIKLIQSNCNKLVNLIDDIIDIAKIEANQIQIRESECDLNNLLEELYKVFQQNTNKSLKLILNKPKLPEKLHIITDNFRLQQVITNLLGNAFKFTDKGMITFGYTLKENSLEFFVKDTGIGINEDSLKLIFERFRQAEESNTRLYGGTGLGLAISKYIINLMGGEIWVNSEKNKGSDFYFTLPYKIAESKESSKIEKSNDNLISDWQQKTVIIAEDEQDSFKLLKTILRKTNINIIHAKTGREVLEKLEQNKNIDLILMDIQMPDINGLEATKTIKSNKLNIPIIAQTAFALPGEKQKCEEAGCDDYITKPINADKLIKLLSSYIGN